MESTLLKARAIQLIQAEHRAKCRRVLIAIFLMGLILGVVMDELIF